MAKSGGTEENHKMSIVTAICYHQKFKTLTSQIPVRRLTALLTRSVSYREKYVTDIIRTATVIHLTFSNTFTYIKT
jgi:hypothetical protein